MIRFKGGVVVTKVTIIVAAVYNAWVEVSAPGDMWVTSGNDSVHMPDSKHYHDEALDFRTRGLSKAKIAAWAEVARRRLGRNYDVVIESNHLHVEYDPK